MPTVNADLVRQLKHALSLAEAGTVTDGVMVLVGPDTYHRTFSIPRPQDVPMMIGEVSVFTREMELIVIGNRTQQQESRRTGVLGRGVPLHG